MKFDNDFLEEKRYLEAKKHVKELKGFYVHLAVYCINTPIIIAVNLLFSPHYHWFWFSVLGWGLAILLHWLLVASKNIFGKEWEKKKIDDLMNKRDS